MTGRKIKIAGSIITLAKTFSDSSSKNELTKARNETRSSEMREIAAHGMNAYLIRMRISGLARERAGIDDIIVNIVKIIVATTRDVSKRIPFDNINY